MISKNSEKTPEIASAPAANMIGPGYYLFAALSFVPILGIVLGPICLIWGLAMLKRGGKPMAVIGAVGFCGQTLFFGFLFH